MPETPGILSGLGVSGVRAAKGKGGEPEKQLGPLNTIDR